MGAGGGENAIVAPLIHELRQKPEIRIRHIYLESASKEGLAGAVQKQSFTYVARAVKPASPFWHMVKAFKLRIPPSACQYIELYRDSVRDLFAKISSEEKPDLVFVTSPVAALAASGIHWKGPRLYMPIDSLELSARNGALGSLLNPTNYLKAMLQINMDKLLLEGNDGTVLVTEREAEFVREKYRTYVQAIPIGCDLTRFPLPTKYEKSSLPTLIFVGTSDYAPNRAALKILLQEIWPGVSRDVPTARLVVVGNKNEEYGKALLSDESIEYHSYVQDLGALLRRAWVACYPLNAGGGMKNKALDAFTCAVAVVGYREAFSGLDESHPGFACTDSNMARRKVVELLSFKHLACEVGARGRVYAEERSWTRIADRYVALMNDLRTRYMNRA